MKLASLWKARAVTHECCGRAVRARPEDVSQMVRSSLAEARTRASGLKHQSVSRSLSGCHSSCCPVAAFQRRRMPGSSTDHRLPLGAKARSRRSPSVCRCGSPKRRGAVNFERERTVEVMRELAAGVGAFLPGFPRKVYTFFWAGRPGPGRT